MHKTRIVMLDDAQAVIIPRGLIYDDIHLALEIERDGVEIRILPARRSLAHVLAKFAKFSPDFMSEGRGEHEQAERTGN